MKKFTLLTSLMMLLGAFMASAQELPTEFYVCGSMTNGEPSIENSSYVLIDEDGDGIYTGEYDFPAGSFEFVIFEGKCGWEDEREIWGTGIENTRDLYSDKEWYEVLVRDGTSKGYIKVPNWKGGKIKFALSLYIVDPAYPILNRWSLQLSAPGQPVFTAPDKLYMVGQFNSWATPDNEAGRGYALSKNGSEGEYTLYSGEFDIPEGELVFKVFTNEGDWDSPYYLGSYLENLELFSNIPRKLSFFRSCKRNATISNWEGGKLEVSAKVKYDRDLGLLVYLTLDGPEQPKTDRYPEGVYLIGNFNNWQLPEGDNLNGAVELSQEQAVDGYISYSNNKVTFPDGDLRFNIYYKNLETKRDVFIGTTFPASKFCMSSKEPIAWLNFESYELLISDNINESNPFTFLDWKSETEAVTSLSFDNNTFSMYSYNAPIVDVPENLYAIVTVDDEDPYLLPVDNGWIRVYGKTIKILYTTENSLSPAPENIYGTNTNVEGVDNDYKLFSLVKGGQPIVRTFTDYGRASFSCNWISSVVFTDGYVVPRIISDNLYILGDVWDMDKNMQNKFLCPSEDNRAIYDEYFKLEMIADNVFAGTFYVDPSKAFSDNPDDCSQFRFCTNLEGWTWTKFVGSALTDFYCLPLSFEDTDRYAGKFEWYGKGNWGLKNWNGGLVHIVVDLRKEEIYLADISGASIEAIRVENEKQTRYFDMLGREVKNPGHGIYIKVTGNHSEKVIR